LFFFTQNIIEFFSKFSIGIRVVLLLVDGQLRLLFFERLIVVDLYWFRRSVDLRVLHIGLRQDARLGCHDRPLFLKHLQWHGLGGVESSRAAVRPVARA